MNTPSTGFQQYGEGLLNKFQSSKVGQMFGGKPRKKYDDDNSKESVRGGNKKDAKYTTVPQGKVERLKVGESESDVLATMYNFMSKNYKKDLDRMKKEKKHKKEIDDFEDLKNKQLIAALTGKKEKTKETKKGKGFGFGSLLKAGLAIGGLVLIEKAFAKMAETGKVADVADVLKTTKKEESTSSLPGTPPIKQNTPSDTTPMSSQGMSGKSPWATKEAKEAFDFFVGKGYTKEAAAGIVANLQAESGPHLNPKALGDDRKAKGIAQWQAARQKTFKEVVGKDVFDASRQEQLGQVDYELKNTHKKAGLAVNQQKTAGEAAAVVDKDYEQSKGLHRQKRMGIAEDLMSAFGGQNIPGTVVAGPMVIKEPSSKPTVSTPTKIKEPPQSEFDDLVKKGIIKPEFKSFADIREFEALVKAGVLDPKSMSHDELIKKYRQIQSKKLKTTINPDVQERTAEEFNALVKKSIEEQNLKSQPKSMSELLKEQERKRLLNPESKNLVPDKKTSMMDRIKQLMSSNIIIIEKEKIVTEIAESNDTSILFNKIQQLS